MRFSSQLGLGPPLPWVPGYRRASMLKNPSGTRSAKVYQACRTSPQSSCEPSEQTSTQAPTIAARFLHPGNTDTRSLRQAKGNTNASITFWYAKSQGRGFCTNLVYLIGSLCRPLGWPSAELLGGLLGASPGGLVGMLKKTLACWESLGVSWVVSFGPAGPPGFLGPCGPPRASGLREPPNWSFGGPL